MELLHLNDDCLRHLFTNLPLADKFRVACVCHRFARVIRELIGKEKIQLGIVGKQLSLEELTQFLFACGDAVRHVTAYRNCDFVYFTIFAKHCSNLEKVEITQATFSGYWRTLQKLFFSCKNLRCVKLIDCRLKKTIFISPEQHLESLHIRKSSTEGMCLLDFRNLVDLNLEFCLHIDPERFQNMLESNEMLKTLNIRGCRSLTNDRIGHALATHKNIEEITLDNQFFYKSDVLPEFSNLKRIRIFSRNVHFHHAFLFKQLCDKHSGNLESLELFSWEFSDNTEWLPFQRLTKLTLVGASYFNDGFLEKISTACKLLEKADFRGSMADITDKGLLDFIRSSKNLNYLDIRDSNEYDEETFITIGKIRCGMGSTKQLIIASNNSKWTKLTRSRVS